MTFLASHWLWLLLGVAALAVIYVVQARRRTSYAVRFANLPLLASVAPRGPGWRRHLPALAFVFALLAAVVALARPARDEQVPRERATVVMALDVSLSMRAEDVEPDRITAAQAAARDFVELLPDTLNLGLVTFAGTANVAVAPTQEHEQVTDALESLTLSPSTAIGEAVFTSLEAIRAMPGSAAGDDPPPARIVLLSDGSTTSGRSNESAAAAAAEAGVPVSTIAFGTDEGEVVVQGQRISVPADRDALQALAEATDGTFFSAVSGDELDDVYRDLGSSIGFQTEQRELTTWFLGLAIAGLFASAAMSLRWFARLP